jgi:hypothetical protein
MLTLAFRCAECGFETTNPTMMHTCLVCGVRLCNDCRGPHEAGHEPGPGDPPACLAPTSP